MRRSGVRRVSLASIENGLGILFGIDLFNLNAVPEVDVPVVSFGAAGTLDQII